MFQFCSVLGVFQGNLRQLGGVFGLSRGVLATSWGVFEASWRLLGGSYRHLGGVLEASWGILDVSWGKCRKNVEGDLFFEGVLGAQMEATIVKIDVSTATCFSWRF